MELVNIFLIAYFIVFTIVISLGLLLFFKVKNIKSTHFKLDASGIIAVAIYFTSIYNLFN